MFEWVIYIWEWDCLVGCKWGFQRHSGEGRGVGIAGRHLIKALFCCGLKSSLWICICTQHTCLIVTHSVSPDSLSCQSHSPCLWKYYGKWNAQATGFGLFSTGVGLVDLLAEPKHWLLWGREDWLVQLEMKTQALLLAQSEHSLGFLCLGFFCGFFISCMCVTKVSPQQG